MMLAQCMYIQQISLILVVSQALWTGRGSWQLPATDQQRARPKLLLLKE